MCHGIIAHDKKNVYQHYKKDDNAQYGLSGLVIDTLGVRRFKTI